MSSLKRLEGPSLPPQSGKTKQLVILLHGYGANGADLLSLGSEWADDLPDAAFVSPNALEPCEAWSEGYQWFSIRAIDQKAFERERQIEKVMPFLSEYIDEQLKIWGVDDSQLAVAGFSQGAMMALYTMPRRQKPCAAVIGYSGMLIDPESLKGPGMVKPPILAIHGDADEIVPPRSLEVIQTGFSAAGFDVETIMRPHLGHSIDSFGLKRAAEFMKEGFEKQS